MPYNLERTKKIFGKDTTVYNVSQNKWSTVFSKRKIFSDLVSSEAAKVAEPYSDMNSFSE